ncbi:MAG TPA: hypothetical protein VH092_28620 [Urbifossiella sp.]|nr:hypothetical protein [Urbifossiella sp.]
MSTESQTSPETVVPGAAVRAAWGKFKRGELIPYWIMAIILVLATGLGLFLFLRSQGRDVESRKWLDLEGASTPQDLEKIVTDYPDSVPAKLAEFHLARIKLGPEGIDNLVTGDEPVRKRALANIEAAKDTFSKMAPEFKDSPVLQAECYLGLAKAEVALIGITKEGARFTDGISFRGSPTVAADWLEKLAAVAEGTPWGDEAKKQAADLRVPNGPLEQDIRRIQTNLYNMALFPSRGGAGMPFGPGGMPFGPGGGMPLGPGGGMPFGPGGMPPGMPIGGIPGMPSGPIAPLPPGHP